MAKTLSPARPAVRRPSNSQACRGWRRAQQQRQRRRYSLPHRAHRQYHAQTKEHSTEALPRRQQGRPISHRYSVSHATQPCSRALRDSTCARPKDPVDHFKWLIAVGGKLRREEAARCGAVEPPEREAVLDVSQSECVFGWASELCEYEYE
jgi:hypothetical protein